MEEFFNYIKYPLLVGVGFVALIRYLINGKRALGNKDLRDKVIIITGCSAGIGKETARALLNKGAKVIFACRDKAKTENVIKNITTEETINNAYFIPLNLASFNSVGYFVNEFNKKFERLDMLINNAGVVNEKFSLTEDNLESTIQTNHISHCFLTGLLFKNLKLSDDPRVINVGSSAHYLIDDKLNYFEFNEENYSPIKNYGISKAGNILFSESLMRFSKHNEQFKNLLSACVDPGYVYTEASRTDGKSFLMKMFLITIFWPISKIFFQTAEMGAQTSLNCCYMDSNDFKSGEYYFKCAVKEKSPNIRKFDLEKKLTLLTYDAIRKTSVFDENVENKDFVDYLYFMKNDMNL